MGEKNGFALVAKHRGAIMGFAALWIMFFHVWSVVTAQSSPFHFTAEFLKRIGFCGVDIFFLLSGIGLTYSIKKGGLALFYYKRVKRIIIPFAAIGIIRCVLENWGAATLFRNLLGINFYTKSIYSFLWFVPAILTLYLLFPLYYKLLELSKKPYVFTACALLIWLICSLLVRDSMRNDLFGFTNRIPVFLIGVLVGNRLQSKDKADFTLINWVCVILALILGLYLSYITNYKSMYVLVPVSNCCVPNLLISISLSILLAKLFDLLDNLPVIKLGGKIVVKAFAFLGAFSFELYVVQEWLAKALRPLLPQTLPIICVNLILFAAIIAVSFALYIVSKYIWVGVEKIVKAK